MPKPYKTNPREPMSYNSGIYCITCAKNNTHYIGSSKNIIKRFGSHLTNLRLNKHIQNAIQRDFNSYGEEFFSLAVLEVCGRQSFKEKEDFWIAQIRLTGSVYNKNKSWDTPIEDRVTISFFISKDTWSKLKTKNNGGYYRVSDYVKSLIDKDINIAP